MAAPSTLLVFLVSFCMLAAAAKTPNSPPPPAPKSASSLNPPPPPPAPKSAPPPPAPAPSKSPPPASPPPPSKSPPPPKSSPAPSKSPPPASPPPPPPKSSPAPSESPPPASPPPPPSKSSPAPSKSPPPSPSPNPAPATGGPDSSSNKALIITVAVTVVSSGISVVAFFIFCKRRRATARGRTLAQVPATSFHLPDLNSATNNFSVENRIGVVGQFGAVYQGSLDGSQIAVRDVSSPEGYENRVPPSAFLCNPQFRSGSMIKKEIMKKVAALQSLESRYLVELKGYCVDTSGNPKFYLVYEYMDGDSVDERLKDSRNPMDWDTRMAIIKDVANSLAYLHIGTSIGQIAHQHVKAKNVFLVSNDQGSHQHAKLADVGLFSLASHWRQCLENPKNKRPSSEGGAKEKFERDVKDFGYFIMKMVVIDPSSQDLGCAHLRNKVQQMLSEDTMGGFNSSLVAKGMSKRNEREMQLISKLGLKCIESPSWKSMQEIANCIEGGSIE